ncbi:hypothetical protein [Zobellia sp. 1_MG-2023]|uniref:hypothetical protein n=1 Tax=Zobellia sp. 1_MG-2023 TaxID=3062626 RepID=UPI0026E280F3|nr:hypothetical protein [Zobellia sp. 1_MG-2023]MDO6818928.1 hypothetical protein [Zobellia sp. 1_MG-2023]
MELNLKEPEVSPDTQTTKQEQPTHNVGVLALILVVFKTGDFLVPNQKRNAIVFYDSICSL